MKDTDAVKDIKERFSKYATAIVACCKAQSRNDPFVKNVLRDF
jgi:hypothetical protein